MIITLVLVVMPHGCIVSFSDLTMLSNHCQCLVVFGSFVAFFRESLPDILIIIMCDSFVNILSYLSL